MSPRERAMAALDRLGDSAWPDSPDASEDATEASTDAQASPKTVVTEEEPDPLAELAKKVEAKLKGKQTPKAQAPASAAWDKAAYDRNPIEYLTDTLGLDPEHLVNTLVDFVNLPKPERELHAKSKELETYKSREAAEKARREAEQEAAAIETAETEYIDHVKASADKYPHLAALDPQEQMRYTYEVATLIAEAGEDADAARLAELTEIKVAKLASKIRGAGTPVKSKAEVGDRTKQSADGSAPRTITNQLTTESGTPAELDLSPEGRRAAAMRRAAALGW